MTIVKPGLNKAYPRFDASWVKAGFHLLVFFVEFIYRRQDFRFFLLGLKDPEPQNEVIGLKGGIGNIPGPVVNGV